MASTSTPEDPFRADAALVYRFLRSEGPLSAEQIAGRVFPTASEGPPSTVLALQKRGLRRVYDSLVWMRHHDAPVWAVPTPLGTIFSLTPMHIDPQAVMAVTSSPLQGGTVTDAVTDEVAQPIAPLGGGAMGLYHPGETPRR